MRTLRRVGGALLFALAASTTVHAQSPNERVSLNAVVGPSFANVGTTFSALADVGFAVNDRVSLVGEYGVLRHAPLADAASIAAPVAVPSPNEARVTGQHWNGNLTVRPASIGRLRPYLTGGIGAFTADTIVDGTAGGLGVQDRRRVTDFATNVGAGALYPLNDWLGLTADYRTFFVHRDGDTPRVHRFTGGLTFSIK